MYYKPLKNVFIFIIINEHEKETNTIKLVSKINYLKIYNESQFHLKDYNNKNI
jgi:hypothetical protein